MATKTGEVVQPRIRLTPKQERFCQAYATEAEFFGNGTAAYIEAYNPSRLHPGWYNAVRSSAHRLLTNANICDRINQLLEEGGLNDQHIDKQLHFLVTQHGDFSAKLGAIREYNKLKKRVDDKPAGPTVVVMPIQVMPMDGGNNDADKRKAKSNSGGHISSGS